MDRPTLPLLAGLASLALLAGCATTSTEHFDLPALETVPRVDLQRYLGTWYEIAAFPQRFQEGCTATTASYSQLPDGEIEVVHRCREGRLDGPVKESVGRARVVGGSDGARLEVSFFRPFWADYWVIDLADDYSYAVVGHPGRDHLWILSRTPTLEEGTYQQILQRLMAVSYETARLERTPQPASPARASRR